MKQVIFNVGGALASYLEYDNKKILIDIGSCNSFNPITDFLVPLSEKRSAKTNNKFNIDQLIISHPHNDHLSTIEDFDKYFTADLVTCPNDNPGQEEKHKVKWSLVDNPSEEYVTYLRDSILPGRKPPLKPTNPINQFLYYIPPKECEGNNDLDGKNYTNNLSVAFYFRINGYKLFMPGDLMKDGMEYLIKHESSLRSKLAEGVDILVTPHHGLKSSFSTYLFDHIKDKKTRCLNIVPEQSTSEDSNRIVDSRYSSTEYCMGINNFSTRESVVCQKKTSTGHIYIDYNKSSYPVIEVINNDKELIKRFAN
jgi:beta-lactamase superfamily II metal-dependent hydrolase